MTNEDRARYGREAMRKGTPDYCVDDDHTNAVDTIANVLHAAALTDTEEAAAIIASAMNHYTCEVLGLD